MKRMILSFVSIVSMYSVESSAALPRYKVNMRVALKGHSPISINTIAKPGKKSSVSEISANGQTETIVEVLTRQTHVDSERGLYMDVKVIKRVRGELKVSERTHLFAPENREMEVGMNSGGRALNNLSLAVMAHRL